MFDQFVYKILSMIYESLNVKKYFQIWCPISGSYFVIIVNRKLRIAE